MAHTHDHDLGLRHDMRTLSRRRLLVLLATGAAASTAAACGGDATESVGAGTPSTAGISTTPTTGIATQGTTEIACVAAAPTETAGPYPGDGSNGPNVLIRSGIVRDDIRSSFDSSSGTADGVPTTIRMTLQDLAENCSAGAGMAVYVWHCDRDGNYSLYDDPVTGQNYLRGVQVADAEGTVMFRSIFPACYGGRWPHIHFEVFDSLASAVAGSDARLTSQIAIPEDAARAVFDTDPGYGSSASSLSAVTLASDVVFGDGWDAEMATVTGTSAEGMAIAITVGVA